MKKKFFHKYNLIPVINTITQLKRWLKFNKNKNKLIIHFDTGMCRLGIQEDKINEVLKLKKQLDQYKEVIIMSHLACSGDKREIIMKFKDLRFEKIKKKLPGINTV